MINLAASHTHTQHTHIDADTCVIAYILDLDILCDVFLYITHSLFCQYDWNLAKVHERSGEPGIVCVYECALFYLLWIFFPLNLATENFPTIQRNKSRRTKERTNTHKTTHNFYYCLSYKMSIHWNAKRLLPIYILEYITENFHTTLTIAMACSVEKKIGMQQKINK